MGFNEKFKTMFKQLLTEYRIQRKQCVKPIFTEYRIQRKQC